MITLKVELNLRFVTVYCNWLSCTSFIIVIYKEGADRIFNLQFRPLHFTLSNFLRNFFLLWKTEINSSVKNEKDKKKTKS